MSQIVKGLVRKTDVILLIQNYIRNIQMNDYGTDSGIPQLYAVMGQIEKLPEMVCEDITEEHNAGYIWS